MLFNGITGLSNIRQMRGANLQQQDKIDFKRICYSINKAEVIGFDFDLIAKNYYVAEIKHNEEMVYLLLNAYYPYLAFSHNQDKFSLNFTMNRELETIFKDYYEILSPDQLNAGISIDELDKLGHTEKDQVIYFNPRRIGDVIFNYWD